MPFFVTLPVTQYCVPPFIVGIIVGEAI